MEFDCPDHPVLGRLYRFYFDHIMPPIGNWLSRTDYAYTYLARSVHRFPAEKDFLQEIAAAGFKTLGVKKLSLGIAKIYRAIKEGRTQTNEDSLDLGSGYSHVYMSTAGNLSAVFVFGDEIRTLMRGDPEQILDFLKLATRVNKKIRQNLFFSGLYNFIAVPIAMSGLLNPLIAVSAMLLSSLSVIGNTILLVKGTR